MSRLLALSLLALSLLGCDPGAPPAPREDASTPPRADAGPPGRPTDPGCAGRPPTTVSGTVTFPNGSLPVARALVYVPTDPSVEPARSGTCGECLDRAALRAVTETDVDGHFVLTVPADASVIVIQKGPFRRQLPIAVQACADNPIDAAWSRLPRDASEGAVPRVAVVTGSYDHMESVLSRLGFGPSAVEIVDGNPELGGDGGAGFFRDRARLTSFDYVFVNCGAGIAESWDGPTALSEPAVVDNLRAFVEGGGRLYVTDLAHDVMEHTAPAAIDFGGQDGLSSTPEPLDRAESGPPIFDVAQAEVVDGDLRAWLRAAGGLDAADRMPLRGLSAGWVMVRSAPEAGARTWVRGPMGMSVRPLTVTTDRGCGRALFTSYHTIEGAGDGGPLSPQEMALAYLILEIGSCIEEPTII